MGDARRNRERLKLGGVMGFTEHHIQHYREHGYAIVENFLSPDELSRSRRRRGFYSRLVRLRSEPNGDRPVGWDEPQRSRRGVRFPFRGRTTKCQYAAS